MKYAASIILISLLFLAACSGDHEEKCEVIPDTKGHTITPVFVSLEDSLPAITTKKQLVAFLTRHPVIRDNFFARQSYPDDSTFINTLFKKFTHPAIDTLLMETHRVFGDASALKGEFSQAFSNMAFYYPDFKFPKIVTMISGFQPGADLLASDSLIVIGLDYFLGKGAKYRPNDMYEYMLRRYQPNFVVPSVVLLYGIDPGINQMRVSDKTVLADMITYGKAFYFAKHMLPCVPDSVLIGYTSKEINGAYENEGAVYSRLVENEVLYSTSHQIKQRYIEERPHTLEVGAECPGRIAQWVGWQIVKAYASRKTDVRLPELMKTSEPDRIFKEAKYKP